MAIPISRKPFASIVYFGLGFASIWIAATSCLIAAYIASSGTLVPDADCIAVRIALVSSSVAMSICVFGMLIVLGKQNARDDRARGETSE